MKVPAKSDVKKLKRRVGYDSLEREGESTSEAMKKLRLDDTTQRMVMDN